MLWCWPQFYLHHSTSLCSHVSRLNSHHCSGDISVFFGSKPNYCHYNPHFLWVKHSFLWVKSMPRCLREIHAPLFVKIMFYTWQNGSLFVKSRCWEWSPCCGFPLHFDRLSDNTSLGPKIYWLIIIWAISPWNLASWDDLRSIFRHSKSYEVGEISNGISYQILMDSC